MLRGILCVAILLAMDVVCAGVAHGHVHKSQPGEREADGAFSPRDKDHEASFADHDNAFDHEAILGSAKEAQEFDQLPPEEAKKRLRILVGKMDTNSDGFVDKKELHSWILRSFRSLSQEESEERFEDGDSNEDGFVSWDEYLQTEFDIDDEQDLKNLVSSSDRGEDIDLINEDKILFDAADANSDGRLDRTEFLSFSHPEEDVKMSRPVLDQTLKAKDRNRDGRVDFQEFVGERGQDQTKEWLVAEKDRFDSDLDKNKDGVLDEAEIIAWIIPNNEDMAQDEVDHLFAGADEDVDGLLSVEEIVQHHDLFVGSEATDYGEHLNDPHKFDDEL